MADISLGLSARSARLDATTVAGAIALDRFSAPRIKRRYSINLTGLRPQLDHGGRAILARRALASGFVDFLLGRGARHSW